MNTRVDQPARSWAAMAAVWLLLMHTTAGFAGAYVLGSTVADMRQGLRSGGTSCPQRTRFNVSTPGAVNRQWSTALGANPVTILTEDQTPAGQLNEIEAVIRQSFASWTGVPGTLLTPASLATLQRTSVATACNPLDGLNSICFDQSDAGFTAGVLAFTRVVTADTTGEQLSPATPPSTFVGEILDADVVLRPGDATTKFATPAALVANPNVYDLESILTHEFGHFFGFSHSGVWRAVMFPFAPPPGQFTGIRPSADSPDAPFSEDDRTGLRVLYPDPSDGIHAGTISGHVLPANTLMLPPSPPGVTGIFPAQVVAVDNSNGAVIAATIAGWSCSDPGPAKFDGSYMLERLPVGPSQSYQIYAEPLDGPVTLPDVLSGPIALCRNAATDPGWPEPFACTVPPSTAPFSARIRPGP